MSEKKLKNFGVIHLKDLSNLNNVEMRVFSLISKKCSKEVYECKKDSLRSPKFHEIGVKEFIESCGLKKSQIFEGINSLVKKGFILKVKVGRKSLFFPVLERLKGRFGMTQEVEMVKLTKNETKVYTYLSSLQGDKESSEIPVSMNKIMEMCSMKSLQMVKRTTANLVKKGVVKRRSNYKSASVYDVMRHENVPSFSPKNVPSFSPKNVPSFSPKNVPPLNNSLKDINNSVFNNPASGKEKQDFFEKGLKDGKGKSGNDNISTLEKNNIVHDIVLGTENKHEHITSFGYTPPHNYVSLDKSPISDSFKNRKKENITVLENRRLIDLDKNRKKLEDDYYMFLTRYIGTLSPEVINRMKDNGCSLNDFISVNMFRFSKTGIGNEVPIKADEIKKISENDKKCLHDYVDKRKLDSGDSFLDDVRDFSRYKFTVGSHSEAKLKKIIKEIQNQNEESVVVFDFGTKSKVNGDGDGKKVW